MSLDEFKWIWKDSTKDEIVKQYYFDYINWKSVIKEWQDLRDKAIDKLKIKQARFINEKDYVLDDNDLDEIMIVLQGSDENE